MAGELKIDVVADVVCPWCYIGWTRLHKALEMRPAVKPALSWTAFQLNPDIPPEGVDYRRHMAKKFDPERLKKAQANIVEIGTNLGIEFHFDKITKAANTNAAHRLIRWAAAEGRLDPVATGVMRAFFTEGRFIGDAEELAAIGAAAGMDRAALLARFATDEDHDVVTAEAEAARDAGVNGVPYYRLGDHITVEGSWPAEDLAQEIDKALAEA
jgi:predicted DsbA family dithiol-disulfide isomerase